MIDKVFVFSHQDFEHSAPNREADYEAIQNKYKEKGYRETKTKRNRGKITKTKREKRKIIVRRNDLVSKSA